MLLLWRKVAPRRCVCGRYFIAFGPSKLVKLTNAVEARNLLYLSMLEASAEATMTAAAYVEEHTLYSSANYTLTPHPNSTPSSSPNKTLNPNPAHALLK